MEERFGGTKLFESFGGILTCSAPHDTISYGVLGQHLIITRQFVVEVLARQFVGRGANSRALVFSLPPFLCDSIAVNSAPACMLHVVSSLLPFSLAFLSLNDSLYLCMCVLLYLRVRMRMFACLRMYRNANKC